MLQSLINKLQEVQNLHEQRRFERGEARGDRLFERRDWRGLLADCTRLPNAAVGYNNIISRVVNDLIIPEERTAFYEAYVSHLRVQGVSDPRAAATGDLGGYLSLMNEYFQTKWAEAVPALAAIKGKPVQKGQIFSWYKK